MYSIENILEKYPNWIPYFENMKNTPQDKNFHAEGNCYIHTNMVLSELYNIILNEDLSEREKDILFYAALFHDIGKPITTEILENEIRAHGHARASYHIANELLEDVKNLDFKDKLEILNLIYYHGKPNWLLTTDIIENKNSEKEIIKFSLDCSNKLLYLLVKADIKGRISLSGDIDEFELNLEYFKDTAIELKCFDKPFQFNTSLDKFNYLVKETYHYLDNSFDDTKSKVYIMSGIPGSGKSTYIKNNLNHLPLISLDNIRKELKIKATDEQGLVINTAKEKAKEYLRKGNDFVWDGTNTTKQMREGLINLFIDYKPYIEIIFIHKSFKDILLQNNNREMVVPNKVIEKLFRKLEYPRNIEAHNVKYII